MSDITKQADYALTHWNLSIGHTTLLSLLVDEIVKLRRQRDNYRRAIQSIHPIYPGGLVSDAYRELEGGGEDG